jgi:CD63 antigen
MFTEYCILTFQISGIAILSVGAIIQNFYSNYTDFLHGKFFVGPVLLIVVGVIVFVVAFFGCCGAIKENHCMILTVSLGPTTLVNYFLP